MIIFNDNNKTKTFKSCNVACLYLIFRWLITRQKVYFNHIELLLWYWKTGATDIRFYF